MMVRHYKARASCLQALVGILRAEHTLHDKRQPGSLYKVFQFLRGLCLHRQPKHLVVAAFAIEGMVNVHPHGHASHFYGMLNLAQHHAIVGMGFACAAPRDCRHGV